MSKIITLSMIKNEADIVELFVRYTLNYAYKMVIIDNGCTDGSREILEKLIEEGLNIEVYTEANVFYEQMLIENKYIRSIYEKENFDYLVLVDVDEFLYPLNQDWTIMDTLPRDRVSLVKWKTYCIMDEKEIINPLEDIIHVRYGETEFTKVILPKNIMNKRWYVTMGHHDVEGITDEYKYICENIWIAHFPVRSKKQIQFKIYQGILAQLMSSYHCVVAFHWKQMLLNLQNNKFDLVDYSKKYALKDETNKNVTYIEERFNCAWCSQSLKLKYEKLKNINVDQILFSLAEVIAIKSIINCSMINKKRVLIYGTGETSKQLFDYFKPEIYEILAYIDSDETKEYQKFNGHIILSPDKIKYLEYDRIIIASRYKEEIHDTLLKNRVLKEKIWDMYDLLEESIKFNN